MVTPVPLRLNWSETPITSSQADQPDSLPNPGGYTMVLDPLVVSDVRSCRFSRMMVDGGRSLNLLYRSSMDKIGIRECDLQPSTTVFHGIAHGPPCVPLGKIRLDVIFGSEENFRREPIWF